MPTAEHLPSTGPVSGVRDLHGSWSLRASPCTHKVRNQRAAELTSSLIRGVTKGLEPGSRHQHSYAAGPGCWARPLSNAPGPTNPCEIPMVNGAAGGVCALGASDVSIVGALACSARMAETTSFSPRHPRKPTGLVTAFRYWGSGPSGTLISSVWTKMKLIKLNINHI